MRFDIIPTEWYNKFNKGEEALVYGYDVRKRGFYLVGNQYKESYYALLGRQDSRSKQGKWQVGRFLPMQKSPPMLVCVQGLTKNPLCQHIFPSLSAFPIIALHRRNTTMSIKR